MKALFDFIDAHASQYVSDLQHLLRQPSISAHNLGINETAAMVERFFTEAGCAAPGVSHPGANIHAPNENIFVDDYIRTIKGIGLLMAEYGRRV
jgi:acetylornithine deacetylase/succinyl-diaminopimelate desuccinylase-like protein